MAWRWGSTAEETRRVIFGAGYVQPAGCCDHLPEIVDHATEAYHCVCGLVAITRQQMVNAPSAAHFCRDVRQLMHAAFVSEGKAWCGVCHGFHLEPMHDEQEAVMSGQGGGASTFVGSGNGGGGGAGFGGGAPAPGAHGAGGGGWGSGTAFTTLGAAASQAAKEFTEFGRAMSATTITPRAPVVEVKRGFRQIDLEDE